jgi:hypothetical protein
MASPTQQDIDKKAKELAKLRSQLSEADAREAVNVAEESRAIEMARLEAEETRLRAELERKRERSKKTSVREGTERLAGQVESQTERVEAQRAANTGNDSKEG